MANWANAGPTVAGYGPVQNSAGQQFAEQNRSMMNGGSSDQFIKNLQKQRQQQYRGQTGAATAQLGGQQQQAPAYAASQTSGASVNPNGTPSPAAAAAPQAAAPAAAPQAPAGQTDPFTAMGGGVWTGSGWVPKDHPLAAQSGQNPAQGGQTAQPNPALMSPYGSYPGRPAGTELAGMQLPSWNFQNYQPTQAPSSPGAYQFSQPGSVNAGVTTPTAGALPTVGNYSAPHQADLESLQLQALQGALTDNPYSAARTAGQKELLKEQATRMGADASEAASQAMASRGRLGSGFDQAMAAGQQQATQEQILKGYRDIDAANAAAAHGATLDTAAAINQALTGQSSRAAQGYTTGLAGNQLQAALQGQQFGQGMDLANFGRAGNQADIANQLAAQSAQAGETGAEYGRQLAAAGLTSGENQFGYQAQYTPAQFALQNALAQHGVNMDVAGNAQSNYQTDLGAYFQNRGLDVQQNIANQGFGVDYAKLGENQRQFNAMYPLSVLQLLSQQQIAGNNLNLGYANLNGNLWNNWLAGATPKS